MNDKLVELEISDLAFDGKSVAHLDGKVTFVNGGLPGETILAEITRSKPRYNEAKLREILKRSDIRVPARCEHFPACGGCTWQDLEYHQQLTFKRKQVVDCIERLGKLESVEVTECIGSREVFNYRNKMEFSFHVDQEGDFTLGLHERGHFDRIFDLNECHLTSDSSNRLVHWIRAYIKEHQIPVYDVRAHTGYVRFVVIRQTKRTNQTMLNLVTNYGSLPDQERLVSSLREAFPDLTTLVHNQNGSKSNIATGEIETVIYGPGYIEEQIFGSTFRIRANSFFQTNSLQAELLYQTGFELLEPRSDDRLLDLYCGTGTIGILAAPHVEQVVGVELVPSAIRSAIENAELNQISNISFFEANVVDFLKGVPEELRQFSAFHSRSAPGRYAPQSGEKNSRVGSPAYPIYLL
ncbi:MAG: 23S rRNA (uracil(1939)-C(5))-methyltransferase RlmD [bacterium]|nr:23S rRNA (uracil(1939)-C(5))-methyltransferase RlmD [bacterium]